MPEFVMEGISDAEFVALDDFTRGYIQALFFTNCDTNVSIKKWKTKAHQKRLHEGQRDGELPSECGHQHLHPKALESIKTACRMFQEQNAEALAIVCEAGEKNLAYTMERAGMDFWYTRCGHGVGFWDRDWDSDAASKAAAKLTKACKRWGDCSPYFGDDDKVHVL